MFRVLGDLIQEGHVVKNADDLYCISATPSEALLHWSHVLTALKKTTFACLVGKPPFGKGQQLSLDRYAQMATLRQDAIGSQPYLL